jgi:hypothetical protein
LPWGLILSIVVTLLLLYTGWLGGKLVFRIHTGISEEPSLARLLVDRPKRAPHTVPSLSGGTICTLGKWQSW